MAIEKARAYLNTFGVADRVLEFDVSSATVELAALALSCQPCRIAKTLSFLADSRPILCPFGVNEGVTVYLDASLRRFETVFPACGSSNSAIELSIPELERYSGCAAWVDVGKGWAEA